MSRFTYERKIVEGTFEPRYLIYLDGNLVSNIRRTLVEDLIYMGVNPIDELTSAIIQDVNDDTLKEELEKFLQKMLEK